MSDSRVNQQRRQARAAKILANIAAAARDAALGHLPNNTHAHN